MDSMSILLIEDDKGICNFLRLALTEAGYEVVITHNALSGIEAYYQDRPELVILDLGLEDLDGMEVIRQLRLDGAVPIIVVSAREADTEKVQALDLGANDYLTKPFSVAELLARIRAVLRLTSQLAQGAPKDPAATEASQVFTGDTFTVDFEARVVQLLDQAGQPDEEVHLTKKEFDLLQILARRPGYVLTHQYLQETVWGYSDEATAVSLRVYVRALRQKLKTELIKTEVGLGYRLLAAQ
ncbi:hypothetical protein BSR28_01450 [Boudabousia liubingyangii]|nr:hypothetical protein BSR28_01450 [Boudabousia liubingyangii]